MNKLSSFDILSEFSVGDLMGSRDGVCVATVELVLSDDSLVERRDSLERRDGYSEGSSFGLLIWRNR